MKNPGTIATPDKPLASVSFSMPKGSKVKCDMPMMVDETATVTINGKVTSISDDKYGRNFSMEPNTITMGGGKKSTMADDLKKVKRGRQYKQTDEDEDDER